MKLNVESMFDNVFIEQQLNNNVLTNVVHVDIGPFGAYSKILDVVNLEE